jgi:hypothetical protein
MHETRGTFMAMNVLRALMLAGVANEPLKQGGGEGGGSFGEGGGSFF